MLSFRVVSFHFFPPFKLYVPDPVPFSFTAGTAFSKLPAENISILNKRVLFEHLYLKKKLS
ncbi:hypothetical protein Mpsy_1365 [Methanolobus psychrophilus R15]|nr:hypothetical protein Mpsy_1365 [Methanolobus psychrophilus R15]